MQRVPKLVVCLGVVLAFVAVGTLPASAQPDNMSEKIVGQGSDTTIFLMESMDRAYNDSSQPATGGCQFVSSPQRLDQVCGVAVAHHFT